MGVLVNLFMVASNPVVKVLLITSLGSFLATNSIDILGKSARDHLNKAVFYVFSPALVGGNLAKTVTWESFKTLWFMPINILITFIIGSLLGWLVVKFTEAPKHLKGLIIGCCSAGNLGSLIIILVPAMCKETGSPFGDPDVCEKYSLAYASLSLGIVTVYLWVYVYNILRVSAMEVGEISGLTDTELSHPSTNYCAVASDEEDEEDPLFESKISESHSTDSSIKQWLASLSEKVNLKALFAPSTIAAIIGFGVGVTPALRTLFIGRVAPLHVLGDSVYMLGDAAIPSLTLIIGANFFNGLKGSAVNLRIVMGIVVVRYIILPLLGIVIVKFVVSIGLVPSEDKMFVFILLIQYALPPAMNIGTITQLFGVGQSDCAVIMLWTYALASVAITLWSTVFLWIVA